MRTPSCDLRKVVIPPGAVVPEPAVAKVMLIGGRHLLAPRVRGAGRRRSRLTETGIARSLSCRHRSIRPIQVMAVFETRVFLDSLLRT